MPSIGVNLRVTGHCSQGGRKYMEDFFSVAYQQSFVDEHDLEYAFIGIYDGHGGSDAAQYAKEHLINLIVNQKAFWSSDDAEVLRAIKEGYIATHYAMWREQAKWPKTATGLPSTAGTTASVAFIRHGKIYIGHCGDSGIVLGYQDDGEKIWRAKSLTEDHKPESEVEKARITNSGGKVVVKAGVPRVVWNRPRLGHKGPVRRSTPIDEIPFLAVARSLGDLWSYNSELDEFVVSPNPDVCVIEIDPKRFKCLVFGTDGLWNVVKPHAAVESVRQTELLNERNACIDHCKEWTNPSKNLVDKALERWSTRKMRADNTSVVVIILDPPGPAKRDLIKSSAQEPYSMQDYLQPADQIEDLPPQHLEIEPVPNYTLFDHRTNEHIGIDTIPLTVMTRYENVTDDHPTFTGHVENTDNDLNYMNSFAESYNSLLNSSLANDHSYDAVNGNDDSNVYLEHSYEDLNGTHQYAADNSYSLTRLQTRSEQMSVEYDESLPSTSHSMYANYKHNLVDHTYMADSSYATETEYVDNDDNGNAINDASTQSTKSVALPKNCEYSNQTSDILNGIDVDVNENCHNETDPIDETTNVDCVVAAASSKHHDAIDNDQQPPKVKNVHSTNVSLSKQTKPDKVTKPVEKTPTKAEESTVKTRKTLASTLERQTRSTDKKPIPITATIKNRTPKLGVSLLKRAKTTDKMGSTHRKENISTIRKVPVDALVNNAITSPIRTRHSVAQVNGDAKGKLRTLRSQNALAKETSSKSTNARAASTPQHVSKIIPKVSQSAAVNQNNNNNNNNNVRVSVMKKMPKRLLNGQVQIGKNNNSISSKQATSKAGATMNGAHASGMLARKGMVFTPTRGVLRVLTPKKPLITVERCNHMLAEVKRANLSTRQMRSQK